MAEREGFAPRHYFSSLVIALLLLYFSHFYYFIVAKCERRQQVAAYSSSELPPIKKDTQGVYIKGIQPFPASGNFINCSEGIRSATLFLFACNRSTPLIPLSFLLFHCRYYAGVANNRFIGCLVGLLFCHLLYRLQADSQPVRIPFRQRQNKTNRPIFACSFCLAEARGFEPLSP